MDGELKHPTTGMLKKITYIFSTVYLDWETFASFRSRNEYIALLGGKSQVIVPNSFHFGTIAFDRMINCA